MSGPGTVNFSPNGTTAANYSTASFGAAGSYVVRVTVFDSAANVTAEAGVTVQPDPSAVLHVAGITMSLTANPTGTRANAKVVVSDQNGAVRSGASVTGTWSGLVSGSSSGTIGTDGSVTLSSPKIKQSGTFSFTVTNVSLGGYAYNPAANVVTSGSITK